MCVLSCYGYGCNRRRWRRLRLRGSTSCCKVPMPAGQPVFCNATIDEKAHCCGALHAPRHCRCPERTPRLVRAETGCEQLRMWKLAVCARVARGGNRFGIFSAMRRLCCAHGTSRLEISGVHGIGIISRSRMLSCPPLLTERPLGLLAVYAQTALHSV